MKDSDIKVGKKIIHLVFTFMMWSFLKKMSKTKKINQKKIENKWFRSGSTTVLKRGIFEACYWSSNECEIRMEDPNGEQVDPEDDPYSEGGDYIILKEIEYPFKWSKSKIKKILEEELDEIIKYLFEVTRKEIKNE